MTGVSLIIFLVYILSAVLISSLIRNTGLSLLVYIFINLALNLSYITINSFVDQNTTIQVLISFIPSYQLFSIMHEGYRRSIALQVLLASSLHYLLLTSIGVFLFERRDIK